MLTLQTSSTLFPYTTLFRSHSGEASTMTFGSLIIASGAYPARLPFEPHDTKVLRTAQDARGIRSDLYDGMNVVILGDRKSTRLNSSHVAISYAVFCLKKKRR